MKARMALLVALAAVAGLTSCDTTQPVGSGPKQMSLSMSATALVDLHDCWNVFLDAAETMPDDPPLVCIDPPAQVQPLSVPVPWNYIADIARVAAGQDTEQTLASSVGDVDEYTSQTGFDSRIYANLGDFDTGGRFFRDGRRISGGNREYLEDFLGLMFSVAEESVLGFSPSFVVEMNKGDTIIVRVRKQLGAESEFDGLYLTLPGLNSRIEIDGKEVNPRGDTSASDVDGSGFTLSYTLR